MVMVVAPATPVFAGPKPTEPVLPPGSRVVSSGQVTVYVNGSTTTRAAWCCSWGNVTNPPYANLGYGSTHLSNGTKANGDLYYFGSPSGWHTVEEFWTNYPISPGWSCSGGPGRISIP
jgi:hypothetical protein